MLGLLTQLYSLFSTQLPIVPSLTFTLHQPHRNATETRSGFVRAPPWNHPRPASESWRKCWSGLLSLVPSTVTKIHSYKGSGVTVHLLNFKGTSFEKCLMFSLLIEDATNTASFVQVWHFILSSANPTLNRNIRFNSYMSAISAESPQIATPKHPWTTFGGGSVIRQGSGKTWPETYSSQNGKWTWNWQDILSLSL